MKLKDEQSKVINHDNGDLLVSASAGSGKTFTMIERIKRLILEKKAKVSEILAVTFTEKAALEMKEKLNKALIAEINNGKVELKEELSELDTADISTFHAFCGRLLRSNFFYVDLSSDFEIMDALETKKIKREIADRVFDELYAENNQGFNTLIERHAWARRDNHLKDLVLSVYSFLFSEAEPLALLEKSLTAINQEGFNEVLKKLELQFKEKLTAAKEAFESLIKPLESLGLTVYKDYADNFLADIEGMLISNIYRIKSYEIKKDLPSVKITADNLEALKLKETLVKIRDNYYKLFDNIVSLNDYDDDLKSYLSTKEHTEAFISLEKRFIEEYSEEKLEENKLDFDDLEHYALKLLESEDFKAQIKGKYKYIFADEYQDTSGVQEKLLIGISNDNLYMVGDIKQSIYGFRGCNPQIFASRIKSLGEKRIANLNCNFRSSDAVINNVNDIFNIAMREKTSEINYKETSTLVRGGMYPEGVGRFSVEMIKATEKEDDEKEETPRIYDILEEAKKSSKVEYNEGKLIAKVIKAELKEQYYDLKEKVYKAVTYGDIAILLRSRTNIDKLIAELTSAGIPVSAESKSNILSYQEVKMFVDILQLIDNYKDEIPLVSFLKNVIKLTSGELARIKATANKWYDENMNKTAETEPLKFYEAVDEYIRVADDDLSKKLADFKKYYSEIRTLSGSLSASEILQKIITDSGIDAEILSSNLGDAKWRRITRFISESFNGDKKLSVKEFLTRIENSADAFVLEETGGENTVKIMTIHASKGLEFPVVILGGINSNFVFIDASVDILSSREYGLTFKAYDNTNRKVKDTALTILMKEEIKKEVIREELRLFYVALTRAEYSLHLVGNYAEIKDNLTNFDLLTASKFTDFIAEKAPRVYLESEIINDTTTAKEKEIILGEPNSELTKLIERNLNFSYDHEKCTKLPLKTSVTASMKGEKEIFEYKIPIIFSDTDAEKGTAAHKFLEKADFEKDAQAEYTRLIAQGEIENNEFDIAKIDQVLKSDIFKNLKGYELYKEQPFIINCKSNLIMESETDEEIMLQGVIDLLAVKGNEAVIIDYKYSAKSKEALVKAYAKQLKLYKYAVEKVLNLEVKKLVIVSLLSGEIIEID